MPAPTASTGASCCGRNRRAKPTSTTVSTPIEAPASAHCHTGASVRRPELGWPPTRNVASPPATARAPAHSRMPSRYLFQIADTGSANAEDVADERGGDPCQP